MKKIKEPEFVMPEISIVLAIQDQAKSLFKIIDSLKNQTFKKWELIVVDNGSKDSPINFIVPFFDKGVQIRYIKQQRLPNMVMAKNIGLRAALGRYIAFIGPDDKFLVDHLQSRYDFMQENPAIALVHGGFEVAGLTHVPNPENPEEEISIYDTIVGETFFGTREFFFQQQGFSENTAFPDFELWQKAMADNCAEQVVEPISYLHTRLK